MQWIRKHSHIPSGLSLSCLVSPAYLPCPSTSLLQELFPESLRASEQGDLSLVSLGEAIQGRLSLVSLAVLSVSALGH